MRALRTILCGGSWIVTLVSFQARADLLPFAPFPSAGSGKAVIAGEGLKRTMVAGAVSEVPESSTIFLLGAGLMVVGLLRRGKRR